MLPRVQAILLLILSVPLLCCGQKTVFATDPPLITDGGMHQQLLYSIPFSINARTVLSCWQYADKDSILLYNLVFDRIKYPKGQGSIDLNFKKSYPLQLNPVFAEIIKKYGVMPPGTYRTRLQISTADSIIYQNSFYLQQDSILSLQSPLRKKANQVLKHQPGTAAPAQTGSNQPADAAQLNLTNLRLSRKLQKDKGISLVPEQSNGKSYSVVYYKGWFLGGYEVMDKRTQQQRAAEEEKKIKEHAASMVSSELEDFKSISSQVKQTIDDAYGKTTASGTFDLTGYFANGQPTGAAQDNNYTELHGSIDTKVLDMPVSLEGFYTTQDQHRVAKASYIRFHYDVEKAKEQLAKAIGVYRNKMDESLSKGKGMDQVYGFYVQSLEAEKQKLLSYVAKEYNIDPNTLMAQQGNTDSLLLALEQKAKDKAATDTAGLSSRSSKADSTLKAQKEKLQQDKTKLQEQYNKILALQQKLDKYKGLLEQYKNTNFLDSALNYSKIKKLDQYRDMSYKDMAKAASGLLPESKLANKLTGLTHLDAGIINQYESSYTMAGQNLKGLSAGYDFGFVQAGFTAGSTQYVGRDGSVDKYSSLLTRLDCKPLKDQKASLIYYTYTPSASMLSDGFFSKMDVNLPSFKSPVHIVSASYDGQIGKGLSVQAEGAISHNASDTGFFNYDRTAVKTAVDYQLPRLPISIRGEWQHMGKNFQNSALPILQAATEKYTLAAEADLFRSFLSLGLQYNLMKQESFSSTGLSRKWGFDVKTHSKRYPSVALSYKPFTTFRSYNDTFTIPQRPISGEVWTGRASYQLKRGKTVHRFMTIYNQNTSTTDTLSYQSRLVQLSYIYALKTDMVSVSTGWMQVPVTDTLSRGISGQSSWFAGVSGSRCFNDRLTAGAGEDVGIAGFGLQKLSTSVNAGYRLKKVPLVIRGQFRYTLYRQVETIARQNLVSGMLGMSWMFDFKDEK